MFDVIGVLRKARNVMGGVLTAESALGSGHAVAMVISGMLKSKSFCTVLVQQLYAPCIISVKKDQLINY